MIRINKIILASSVAIMANWSHVSSATSEPRYPSAPPACQTALGPDHYQVQVTRLGVVKQELIIASNSRSQLRDAYGPIFARAVFSLKVVRAFALLFQKSKPRRSAPEVTDGFLSVHMKAADEVITLLRAEAERMDLGLPPSDDFVHVTNPILVPNGAITIERTAQGRLVVNTALGAVYVFNQIGTEEASRLIVAVAPYLGLLEVLPAATDGEFRSRFMQMSANDLNFATFNPGKMLAVTHLPSGGTLSTPILAEFDDFPPNEIIAARWNTHRPPNRQAITSDRVHVTTAGWRYF